MWCWLWHWTQENESAPCYPNLFVFWVWLPEIQNSRCIYSLSSLTHTYTHTQIPTWVGWTLESSLSMLYQFLSLDLQPFLGCCLFSPSSFSCSWTLDNSLKILPCLGTTQMLVCSSLLSQCVCWNISDKYQISPFQKIFPDCVIPLLSLLSPYPLLFFYSSYCHLAYIWLFYTFPSSLPL